MNWLISSRPIVCVLAILLVACNTTPNRDSQTDNVEEKSVPNVESVTVQPNPKPRPKDEPIYPSAEQVISWHASSCGGFKVVNIKSNYVGEQALKTLFSEMCLNSESEPQKMLELLAKTDQAFYWPDDIKQYLWLQKHNLKQQVSALKANQALAKKMQQTLSSLATIEQQLLIRETSKEQ